MSDAVVRFERVGATDAEAGLTAVELTRRARLRSAEDRESFTAAHLLVRECAGELLGVAGHGLVVAQSCATCGQVGHGRPTIVGHPEVHVSLSHTRGCVAAIAARSSCGIDVESVHRGAVPSAVLTEREASWVRAEADPALAFTTLWVRKEALVKAGSGSIETVGSLDVLDAEHRLGVRAWAEPPYVGAWVVPNQAP